MNKKFFNNPDEIVDECELLVNEDRLDAEDRANIAAFYNGRETLDACQAEREGITELTNHLFGHDAISTATNQISSLTNKSPTIFRVTVNEGPIEKRQIWSDIITERLNEAIVKSGRLNSEWKSGSGEITLFGRCHLIFPDTEDWCPIMKRVYVPRGTRTSEKPQFVCVRDTLSLMQLKKMWAHADRVGEGSAWKKKGLKNAIDILEGNFVAGVNSPSSRDLSNGVAPDEEEYEFQEGGDHNSRHRVSIPVYYMFTARSSEPGCPYDLQIVSRFSSKQKKLASDNSMHLNPLLYDKDRVFSTAKEFIHSFFVDVSIGGESTWHRTEGMGHLNYDPDVDTEEFFNAAMQGSKENLRRMFRISNAADRETLDRWLMGDEYSNVIPEGVEVVEGTKNPNFQYAFTTMQMLQQLSRRNASASISNSELGNSVDELEVQALERQGRSAEAIANRMNEIYLNFESMGEEIVRRFLNTMILPIDGGYDEIEFFQSELKKEKIPIKFIAAMANGRFKNITVKVNRVAGDGDSVREQLANSFLLNTISLYSPQSQQKILRRITASQTRDHDLAEELVPTQPEENRNQILDATNENDACYLNGISVMVSQQPFILNLGKADVHLDHIPVHIQGLQSLLAMGQVSGWTEKEVHGFSALGRHTMLHVNEISKRNPQQAQQIKVALQRLSGVADQLVKQLQAKRDQEQQQIDPKDAAKLQLDAEKLKLAQEKERAIQDDRTIKNTLKANEIAVKNEQGNQKLSQEDRRLARELRELEDQQVEREKASQEVLSGEREGQGNKSQ